MKITLKVNTNDNDRIEMWVGQSLITVLHVDDLFPTKADRPARDSLYGREEMNYKLEEDIDG